VKYPVRHLCQTLKVHPSGYYAWRSEPKSGQLEGYILALLDLYLVTEPQGKQLLKAAAELFGQCRSEYLRHKQKPRRHIAGAVGDRIRQSQRRSENIY